jgi:hypothetical protein
VKAPALSNITVCGLRRALKAVSYCPWREASRPEPVRKNVRLVGSDCLRLTLSLGSCYYPGRSLDRCNYAFAHVCSPAALINTDGSGRFCGSLGVQMIEGGLETVKIKARGIFRMKYQGMIVGVIRPRHNNQRFSVDNAVLWDIRPSMTAPQDRRNLLTPWSTPTSVAGPTSSVFSKNVFVTPKDLRMSGSALRVKSLNSISSAITRNNRRDRKCPLLQ